MFEKKEQPIGLPFLFIVRCVSFFGAGVLVYRRLRA